MLLIIVFIDSILVWVDDLKWNIYLKNKKSRNIKFATHGFLFWIWETFIGGLLTWSNEDDRMNMTEAREHDQSLTTPNIHLVNLTEILLKIFMTTNMAVRIWLKTEKNNIFLVFSQTQSLSVMLNECTFLIVSFGQVQTYAVYRFRSNSTITFGHMHSVKLTSLVYCWFMGTRVTL